jgi:hypothetical protein
MNAALQLPENVSSATRVLPMFPVYFVTDVPGRSSAALGRTNGTAVSMVASKPAFATKLEGRGEEACGF